MRRAGELNRLAKEMSIPASPAKERALRSLLEMKRSGELERIAQEMSEAQDQLEEKAAQLKEIAARMRKGLLDARRSGELERIAREATQMLDSNALTIGERLRKGLLRAHRTGELEMLRWELDELDDLVPALESLQSSPDAQELKKDRRVLLNRTRAAGQRWSELATSSESDFDPRQKLATRGAATASGS